MTEYKNNKLEVTDEMVEVAKRKFMDRNLYSPYSDISVKLKMILEAVFAMLPEAVSANNAQSKDDGWISAKKGGCPVSRDTLVEVKYPDGSTDTDNAYKFHWNVDVRISDPIIAYRIIDKPEPEKEKRYYGHIDKDGNYTFPHDEPQKKENNLELICDCICHGTICALCAPKSIPTFEAYCYNGSVQDFFELNANVLCKKMSEYLDKYMKVKE